MRKEGLREVVDASHLVAIPCSTGLFVILFSFPSGASPLPEQSSWNSFRELSNLGGVVLAEINK